MVYSKTNIDCLIFGAWLNLLPLGALETAIYLPWAKEADSLWSILLLLRGNIFSTHTLIVVREASASCTAVSLGIAVP